MADLSPSLATGPSSPPPPPPPYGPSTATPAARGKDWNKVPAEQLVIDFCDPELREDALRQLYKVAYFPHPSLPPRRAPCFSLAFPVEEDFAFVDL
uniref:Uncharacterized protein n=1 Tax=Aegilops tauschii TaxID=37682 RepID=R7WCK1_AEGTA